LYYPDSHRLASGGQGSEYGRCFWRFQPNRFRFQRRGYFSGKNDGGGGHHFHADLDNVNLFSHKEDVVLVERIISPCDKTSSSRNTKVQRAAGCTRDCAWYGPNTGRSTGSEVKICSFHICKPVVGIFKTLDWNAVSASDFNLLPKWWNW
jgi:hypothetical protein